MKDDLKELKVRLAWALMEHVGKEHAIGMGELYEKVYGKPWQNRINDTRALRHLITDLRKEGKRVCSAGSGYYLAAVDSELEEYLARRRRRALTELGMEAAMRKKSLPELLGQLSLDLESREQAAEGAA
jgi:hypothetical protein